MTTLLVVVNRRIVATLTGDSIISNEIVRYYQSGVENPGQAADGTGSPLTTN